MTEVVFCYFALRLDMLQLALMIIFNDGAMVAIAWDRVPGSRFPMRWNLPMLFLRATLIGLVVAGSQVGGRLSSPINIFALFEID